MGDKAHNLTDKELAKMERHLNGIYARAEKELEAKADKYFKRFAELDAKKRELVDAGKITEADYKRWLQNKIMTGRHWTAMKEQVADELARANSTALEYVNGRLPSIYSLNYNSVGEAIEGAVSGYSFELVDASTVKHLATADRKLLPYKHLDIAADKRWNMQTFQSEVLQGIIQGESVQDISKRIFPEIMSKTDLTGKTDKEAKAIIRKNKQAAIRNARTMVTGAENKGRMDSYQIAQDKGVRIVKVWMATVDERTREEHIELDGQEREIDEPFENSLGTIMYPGDPEADPGNVYNCRCTMITRVLGFDGEDAEAEDAVADEAVQTGGGSFLQQMLGEEYNPSEFYEAFGDSAEAYWPGGDKEKAEKVEKTMVALNKSFPLSQAEDREYSSMPNKFVVTDYSEASLFLPDGEDDRRIDEMATAQVFENSMTVDGEEVRQAVIAFNRDMLFESDTISDVIEKRARSIRESSELLDLAGQNAEAVTIHEWGHLYSEHMVSAMIYDDPDAHAYWDWYKSLSKEEIRSGLSIYASENRGEFEAECFLEMQMPDPRPIAVEWWSYMSKIIEKGY